jgi:hypothetical protein
MKKLILIFVLTFLTACSGLKHQSKNVFLTYEASTRGSFVKITADAKQWTFTRDRDGKEVQTTPMKKEDWNQMIDLLEKANYEKLDSFQAPSNDRARDAAMIGKFFVKVKDKEYKSVMFDHGNPPTEIEKIVSKMTENNFKN